MTQSEQELEQDLIQRLRGSGYEAVQIRNSAELKANFKTQLEKHNKTQFSDLEFTSILNHLDKGNVFDRAKRLRDKMELNRDDGSTFYLEFLNTEHWCQNEYQVTHQVTHQGKYKNRYDVTLLINGLPLVQIELKRRGLKLKEAFNQINRYHRHSYSAEFGLFQYIQIFVISNGVNTRYYANNRKQEYKQTFFWADKDNNLITQLEDFADCFLEKCHVSKMICKYIVLHESDKVLMVLRPYQYYAVEAIIERVKDTDKNGYIWHTTGSGKTLTSFKAAQILTQLPQVHKVLFVVDRADLDYQTSKEFNYFSPDCVNSTDNTNQLVEQMTGDNSLIVTTIQKLNTAIKKTRHETAMGSLRDKRIVFIFDECHRSQFGETHKKIVKFFPYAQMFGFTGTPILAENAVSNEHGKRTTRDLFEEPLHKYVITNAIADENVLKFSVEYWGKIKHKDGTLITEPKLDREFFANPERISLIVDWIIAQHNRKTSGKKFSAMLCVSNVDTLITYYEAFKRKQNQGLHDLRVITVFTPSDNEDDADANGLIGEPDFEIRTDRTHNRDKLNEFIADYNQMYQTQHSAKDSQAFYAYYKDISKRMKDRDRENFEDKDRADILLVVNMFLTGFDVKKINTLYVDKNLQYHGLIQAYSRTNRILGELKSQGNIVCFRNLKENTDKAVALFSNANAKEEIFIQPYEHYIAKFNAGVQELRAIATIPNDVNKLISEDDQVEFVKAFRNLIRLLNVSKSFTEFDFSALNLDEQTFEDYKSKYLDIYDKTRAKDDDEEPESLIDEVDFELELIQRDDINVAYILKLLADLQRGVSDQSQPEDYQQKKASILELLDKEVQLRGKRDLIEKFIDTQMPTLEPEEKVEKVFKNFWNQERVEAVRQLCRSENLNESAVNQMIANYKFSGKEPLRETVLSACNEKPKLLERKKIFKRIVSQLLDIINKFDDALGEFEESE
jgi:type I restriction enzyme, R subunit